MQHETHWKNSVRSEVADYHARKRATVSLDRFAGHIRTVTVTFEDLNGPKGGVDKRCTVEAIGNFVPRIASATATNYLAAADLAIGKLERGVARALDRKLH